MTFPTAEDIWLNEDYSNDHDIPNKGQYVYCPQLPWFATQEEAESLKQQILSEHEIVERLKEEIKELAQYKNVKVWSHVSVLGLLRRVEEVE